MKSTIQFFSFIFVFHFSLLNCLSQPGQLDSTFQTGTGFNSNILAICVQPDGKIIAGGGFGTYNGTARGMIARLNSNGSLDTVFNINNLNTGTVKDFILQPDGKIIAAGYFSQISGASRASIARLNPDGSIDTTFNPGAGFDNMVASIALQSDGKIIAVGDFDYYNGIACNSIVRLNADGSYDGTFNYGSGFPTSIYFAGFHETLVQPDGKILVAGDFTEYNGTAVSALVRLNPDGSRDLTFNPLPPEFEGWFSSIVLQPDGKIIAGGGFTHIGRRNIVRLNTNGDIDNTFMQHDQGFTHFIYDLALMPDGKVIVAGMVGYWAETFEGSTWIATGKIARLNADGSFNTDFTLLNNVSFNDHTYSLASQPDGKILVGGLFTAYNTTIEAGHIARLEGDLYFSGIDSLHHESCNGNDGYISLHAIGGTPPYEYVWNTTPVQSGNILSNLVQGTYTVSIIDATNTTSSVSVGIQGPSSITGIDLSGQISSTTVRPGVAGHIFARAGNYGCYPVNGVLKIVPAPLQHFLSSTPPPDYTLGDTLFWNFSDLNYDLGELNVFINFITDISAQIGDTACLGLFIETEAEAALPELFSATKCYPVVNSYDPNDKQVYPQGDGIEGYIVNNQKMYYTIRFQNTGNAEAFNIYIVDTLDSNLDFNTLRITGYSHDMKTEILSGNILKFKFDDIHLPDSNSNEELSHGYVMYEINQKPNLSVGTTLKNTAYIYFDFNGAIITNSTINTITTPEELDKNNPYAIIGYPNPSGSNVTIEVTKYGSYTLSVIDATGKLVSDYSFTGKNYTFDLSKLSAGVYFLRVIHPQHGDKVFKLLLTERSE